MVTNQVLDKMCGICTNGHGHTEFCYDEDCDKKRRRRSTSNGYQKNSLQATSTNVGDDVEISFPIQGNKYITTYAGVFPYISVVDAPGSAYFTVKNVPSTAEVVVNAAIACLPMVLLMTLFAWTAGIVIWILVSCHVAMLNFESVLALPALRNVRKLKYLTFSNKKRFISDVS